MMEKHEYTSEQNDMIIECIKSIVPMIEAGYIGDAMRTLEDLSEKIPHYHVADCMCCRQCGDCIMKPDEDYRKCYGH